MAEKRLVLRKTSGVLRKSCEVFYGPRGREGRDGTEGEIKGADGERTGRIYTKKSPTVGRTVGECVVGVPLGETRDAERV